MAGLGDKAVAMRQLLSRHPESQGTAAATVEVSVARPHINSLVLSFIVAGNIKEILAPAATAAARADGLWQHTCFEAFVRASAGAEYYELNFSPSTQWAAYTFSGYRCGMAVAAGIVKPAIQGRFNSDRFTLQTTLDLDGLSVLSRTSSWYLGLSAVIEDLSGRKSYWALAHPPGKPDFHHENCFAYEFSPGAQT